MKFSRIGVFALAAVVCITAGAAFAQYYNTLNYMVPGGADWEVGGTLNIQPGAKFTFAGVTLTNPVGSPTASVRIAGAEQALSGTNPTTVATGLTTITSCQFSVKESSSPGVGTSMVTYTDSGGTLSMYAWKVTSSSNPTLIASTGTDTIGWNCEGT